MSVMVESEVDLRSGERGAHLASGSLNQEEEKLQVFYIWKAQKHLGSKVEMGQL